MFGKKSDKDKKQQKGSDKQASEPAPLSAAERARMGVSAPRPAAPPAPSPQRAPVQAAPPAPQAQTPSPQPKGEAVPAVLGAAAALLLETCLGRIQDVAQLRASITGAGFRPEPPETARAVGRALALESKMVAKPMRDMAHVAYSKEHHGVPAVMLLSTAQSELGGIVFCSALFGGATEREAVHVVERMTKITASAGGLAHDPDGNVLRRIFWQLGGAGGLLAIALSGPEDQTSRDVLRALTAMARTS